MIPKFKAWDKFDKEMLELHGINFDAQGIWTREMIDVESDGNFVFLDEVELLQFTGLKDKNGVEIYEGDIVKAVRKHSEPKLIEDRYCKGIITYSHGCYDIEVEPNVFSGLIPENLLTDIDLTIEVIGNIYENGDLLK